MYGSLTVSGICGPIADSCAWDVSRDLAMSTALSRVGMEPFAVSSSLTLVELVPNTRQSCNMLSGSLKSQSWARVRSAVMTFPTVLDGP